MCPLFATEAGREGFRAHHAKETIPKTYISEVKGRCWLDVDVGSTTIKAVLIGEQERAIFTHYASDGGDPLITAADIVKRVRSELPEGVTIGRSCATGHGEGLVAIALTMDEGEIETTAHLRAAKHTTPGVASVVDIGGQDVRHLHIRDRAVDSINVNETCSSDCGSFLQTLAETMGIDVYSSVSSAMKSISPVDLRTRYTVFMDSPVKQVQKEGADARSISVGLSYLVMRSALYKVVKLRDLSDLGERVVVQGGTFLNGSILCAFELFTGREVIRPDIVGLMGAYGAVFTARMHDEGEGESCLATIEDLESFPVETGRKTCRLCRNHCQMTISTFSNGGHYVSGDRYERDASLERAPKESALPNAYDWKYKRIFGHRHPIEDKAHQGDIGVPCMLGMYENYPLWFTMFGELGFRVMISDRSSREPFEAGMESIPSEDVCYPARLVHGRIESPLDKGIIMIFYPYVGSGQKIEGTDNHFNCLVVATYPRVIRNNMGRLSEEGMKPISPLVNPANRDYLPAHLSKTFKEFGYDINAEEIRAALDTTWDRDAAVKREIKDKGTESIAQIRKYGVRDVVLAGRPYHLDPEISHEIPEAIIGLGIGVSAENSITDRYSERPLRVHDQWSYHSCLYEAAARVGDKPDPQLVQLNSLGYDLDVITADQAQEILESHGDIHAVLKIDEVSNLGAAKIRLCSLDAAVAEHTESPVTIDASLVDPSGKTAAEERTQIAAGHIVERVIFTKKIREEGYEILAPQIAPIQFRLVVPVLRRVGFNVRLLEHTNQETMEAGLKFVNNNPCYPATVVIDQLFDEFVSGRSDPNKAAAAITQTSGMCRATNYASLLRKSLCDIGHLQVPVIAMSVQGYEDNPGFMMTTPMVYKTLQAIVVGDAIQSMFLRVYLREAVPGSAMRLHKQWGEICTEWLSTGRSTTFGKRLSYPRLIAECMRELDALKLRDIERKPRVGPAGEILVKFHLDVSSHAVDVIEIEGCEAISPGLIQLFHNSAVTSQWDRESLGIEDRSDRLMSITLWAMKQYERPMRKAFVETKGKFEIPRDVHDIVACSQDIVRLGNRAGEG